MRRGARMLAARCCAGALVALTLAGCVDEQTNPRVPAGDFDAYRSMMLDDLVVAPGCATLDCHGAVDRPLRLYSKNGLRLDPADISGGDDTTEAELRANVSALIAVEPSPRTLRETLVLSKPLAGGIAHAGGDVFPDRPGFTPLCEWIADAYGFDGADCATF